MTLPVDPSAPTDFDFYIGSWRVRHRRLKDRLVGSTTWEEFDGRCIVTKLLGGFANVDDTILEMPSGTYRALALRAFDPKSSTWSIWWLDSRDPRSLGVPVVGRFADGEGTFLANETLSEQPVVVRFRWTRVHSASPHWEQAFSADRGTTWEVNWTMDFKRE